MWIFRLACLVFYCVVDIVIFCFSGTQTREEKAHDRIVISTFPVDAHLYFTGCYGKAEHYGKRAEKRSETNQQSDDGSEKSREEKYTAEKEICIGKSGKCYAYQEEPCFMQGESAV